MSGIISGKSEVDMSNPVHAVATPLNTCRASRACRDECRAVLSHKRDTSLFPMPKCTACWVACRVETWRAKWNFSLTQPMPISGTCVSLAINCVCCFLNSQQVLCDYTITRPWKNFTSLNYMHSLFHCRRFYSFKGRMSLWYFGMWKLARGARPSTCICEWCFRRAVWCCWGRSEMTAAWHLTDSFSNVLLLNHHMESFGSSMFCGHTAVDIWIPKLRQPTGVDFASICVFARISAL